MLAPVFLIASDFIATRFSSGGPVKSVLANNKPQTVVLNHVYGSKYYNTSLKKFPKND